MVPLAEIMASLLNWPNTAADTAFVFIADPDEGVKNILCFL
jgi:hypothetical protein